MRGLFLSFFILSLGCAQNAVEEKSLYESGVVLTDQLRAGRYSNIYFAGQPQLADWEKLKEEGFTHVINFRESSEYDEAAEKKKVEGLGMIYTQLPMDASKPLNPSKVKAVTQAVVAHRKKGKTLLHCGSGNRVAYWAGAHFYLDHKYTPEKSVEMAETMGLTSDKLKEKLTLFMKDNKVEQ